MLDSTSQWEINRLAQPIFLGASDLLELPVENVPCLKDKVCKTKHKPKHKHPLPLTFPNPTPKPGLSTAVLKCGQEGSSLRMVLGIVLLGRSWG